MKRERYEFLLSIPFIELCSTSVTMKEFEFVLNNSHKDIETIEFED